MTKLIQFDNSMTVDGMLGNWKESKLLKETETWDLEMGNESDD